MAYDSDNIFARILRGEIPARKVYEDPYAFAFHDISPQAPVHILVIPKGEYVCFSDFTAQAEPQEVIGFWKAVDTVATSFGLEKEGFRLVTNIGENAGQEVPHFHVHLLGGAKLGPVLPENMAKPPCQP